MGWLVRAMSALAVIVLTAKAAPGAERPAKREGFVVEPFGNTKRIRLLDHLVYGLPAVLAERLAQQRPLRFEGGPELFGAEASASAKWIVTGSFERQADWKIAVTVEIKATSPPSAVAARATRVGSKDEVERTALEAALAAFMETPGVSLTPANVVPSITARFARDPYAFVLYGRALGLYQAAGGSAVRIERAVAVFKRSLVIDPKVPEVRRYLGIVHLNAGRPGHARAMLTYALDVRPDFASALRTLAALDRTAGLPAARERYARVLELDPDDLEARRAHGELLAEAGLLLEAQKDLEVVLAAAPDDMRARRHLVMVLASRRAGKELVAELEAVVKRDPDDVDARMDLGAAYLSIGRNDEAAMAYEEVLLRRPRHTGALKLAADLASERGDLKRASIYYSKLRWLSPQDPRPVFLLAAAHHRAGNLDMAERLYTDGARFPGMLGEAYSNIGAIFLDKGDPKQALWFLSRAAKRRPNKANVRYNHALALHLLGRGADALNELRAAEAADPRDVGVRFLAGVVALRLGLLHDAAASFQAALELDPQHADARHNLALLEPVVRPRREGELSFAETPLPPPPPPPASKRPPAQRR
jgi:Flp pilus assembly protein TadD